MLELYIIVNEMVTYFKRLLDEVLREKNTICVLRLLNSDLLCSERGLSRAVCFRDLKSSLLPWGEQLLRHTAQYDQKQTLSKISSSNNSRAVVFRRSIACNDTNSKMYKKETYRPKFLKSLTNLLLGKVCLFSNDKRTASIFDFCLRGKKTGS